MEYRFKVHHKAGYGYWWRFVAPNNQIVAISGEGYTTKANAQQGIGLVKTYAPAAKVYDHTV